MSSPSLDGSAVAATHTGVLPGLTTAVSNDLILVFVSWQNAASPKSLVTGVTSAHLTFTRRSQTIDSGNDHAVEIWAARASGTLSSEVITIAWDNTPAGSANCAQAFQNVSSTIWDTNASLPKKSTGTPGTPGSLSGVSTTLADDLLLYSFVTTSQPASSFPPPTGWTVIKEQTDFSDSANFCSQSVGFLSVSSIQSSITVTGGGSAGASCSLIVDAITSDAVAVATPQRPSPICVIAG